MEIDSAWLFNSAHSLTLKEKVGGLSEPSLLISELIFCAEVLLLPGVALPLGPLEVALEGIESGETQTRSH